METTPAPSSKTPIPTTVTPVPSPASITELSFLDFDASSTAAAQVKVKVRIPLGRIPSWKALFANGSNAQIVYSSDADVFLIISALQASNASSPRDSEDTDTHLAPSATASTIPSSQESSTFPFTTTLIVAVVVVALAAALCIMARKRLLKRGETGLLSSILVSTRRKVSASPSILEDRWSEWSTSSRNIVNVCESPKRTTTYSNMLLSAQATPKRVPLVIYESEQ